MASRVLHRKALCSYFCVRILTEEVKKMNDWTPIAVEYHPLKAGSIDGTDEEPHDRAVSRAMSSRYVPNKGVCGDPELMLFISRLNLQTNEEKVKEVFSRYGDIRRVRLVRDLVTGFSKGYAFVEYKEERSIIKAHRDANKLVIDQHEIMVDFELERTLKGWIPRRFGGGFGGKKESGQLRFGGRDRPFRKPINLPALQNDFYAQRYSERRARSRERVRKWRERSRDRDRNRETRRQEERLRDEEDSEEERSRDRERKDRERPGKKRERDQSRERSSRDQSRERSSRDQSRDRSSRDQSRDRSSRKLKDDDKHQ